MSEIIRLENVCLDKYGKRILDGISLSISCGECCGLIGANGSGKSSLLSLISGYDWASEGSIWFCGERYGEVNIPEVRKEIGLLSLSRTPEFSKNLTVFELIKTGVTGTIMPALWLKSEDMRASQKAEELLAEYEMQHFKSRRLATLSTGEMMKTLLLRAVAGEPKLLLLDEPASGLDIFNRALILDFIKRLNNGKRAIMTVTHHLEELPDSLDSVTVLKSGREVITGCPEEVLKDSVLSEAFACRVEVVKIGSRYLANASL
ncbi:ABC transporter ATP-binding protein [Sedimentisphaera salicampi]|uniref:ABC transporter ATP-binding protein n=1 Tax=Sedimentisphaera salicampi TaxID=1941349 RepID=UPI000B9B8C75|nr:ATP-binding cassette domain-containing protein [Sedimentisphaera salicampi]OXU14037.1 putative ABC transporter ATP-binding protein YlmA [Sedimentisphaera salicampi]